MTRWPSLVLIGILQCEIFVTPVESLGVKLGVTAPMRALVFVNKLSGTSFHEVLPSHHMFTRATTRAGGQVSLSPLSKSGDDRPSSSPWATVSNASRSLNGFKILSSSRERLYASF